MNHRVAAPHRLPSTILHSLHGLAPGLALARGRGTLITATIDP
jgi:hypothetical protein